MPIATGTDVLAIIDEVAATTSRTDKENILWLHVGDPFFVKVLKAVLDPFVTYGVKKMPKVEPGDDELTVDSPHWDVLAALAVRELTGNEATGALIEMLGALNESSAELMRRVLLKDLRAGFSKNTVNKLLPGTIPTFDCMLAHKYEEKRIKKWPVAVEPKLDGVRVLAFVDGSSCRFFSRSGKEFTTFDHLKMPLMKAFRSWGCSDRVVLDAEVASGSFNKTVSEVRRSSAQATDAKLYIFDILPESLFYNLDRKAASEDDNQKRRKTLEGFISHCQPDDPLRAIPRFLANSHDEIMALYAKFRGKGLEGAIVKPLDGLYHRRRNHAWMKIKGEETIDVRVTGIFEGTGKFEGSLGGLVVDVDDVEVRVGSGLSDKLRADIWCGPPEEIVGRLIEVEYHEKTPDGSLRHPRFVRFRDDKDMKDAA